MGGFGRHRYRHTAGRSKIIVRLASYNIQYGFGLDGRFDLERIAAAVADADVIALQEVTRGFPKNGGRDLVGELKDLLPGRFCAFGPAMDVDAGSVLRDGHAVEQRMQFGNMVLSRYPIAACRAHLLPRRRRGGRLNLQRGALETVLTTPEGALRVYSVHLDHIDADERIAQIEALRAIAAGEAFAGGAVTGAGEFGFADPPWPAAYVLMGDFNMQPGSREHAAMTGKGPGDPPVDLAERLGARSPTGWSWIDPKEPARRAMLDYCFAAASLVPFAAGARYDEAATGSDHIPLWVALSGLPDGAVRAPADTSAGGTVAG